jgi:hypothetical protein
MRLGELISELFWTMIVWAICLAGATATLSVLAAWIFNLS